MTLRTAGGRAGGRERARVESRSRRGTRPCSLGGGSEKPGSQTAGRAAAVNYITDGRRLADSIRAPVIRSSVAIGSHAVALQL